MQLCYKRKKKEKKIFGRTSHLAISWMLQKNFGTNLGLNRWDQLSQLNSLWVKVFLNLFVM